MPTDKLFTGQRLDRDTGLYYYGARYYDQGLGRFISPDIVVQNPGNPQTLNRYSYCLNNPLKYADPTGLDCVVFSGTGQDMTDYEMWQNELLATGWLSLGEDFAFFSDNSNGLNIEPRIDQIIGYLAEGHSDIKMFGFSEGSAALAIFGANLCEGVYSTGYEGLGKGFEYSLGQISSMVFFERPSGLLNGLIPGYDESRLNDLPGRLESRGIPSADVWVSSSLVHRVSDPTWSGISGTVDVSIGDKIKIGAAIAAGLTLGGMLGPGLGITAVSQSIDYLHGAVRCAEALVVARTIIER
jgi:RHS repeat-associated protein